MGIDMQPRVSIPVGDLSPLAMGADREGGARGVQLHPMEFENDDVTYCLLAKFPKSFAHISGARTCVQKR